MKTCAPTGRREDTLSHGCQHIKRDRFARCGAVSHLYLSAAVYLYAALLAAICMTTAGCSSQVSENGGSTGVRKPGQVDLQPMDLAQFGSLIARQRGKVVVVDIWATYCPPCMRDFHHLVELHQEEDRQKVVCMSLNIDNQGLESIDRLVPRVLQFLEQQKATFDNILMTDDADQVYRALKLTGIPAILVYDQQGQLVETVIPKGGESPYTRVKELIRQLTG